MSQDNPNPNPNQTLFSSIVNVPVKNARDEDIYKQESDSLTILFGQRPKDIYEYDQMTDAQYRQTQQNVTTLKLGNNLLKNLAHNKPAQYTAPTDNIYLDNGNVKVIPQKSISEETLILKNYSFKDSYTYHNTNGLIDEKVYLYEGGTPGRDKRKPGDRQKELSYERIYKGATTIQELKQEIELNAVREEEIDTNQNLVHSDIYNSRHKQKYCMYYLSDKVKLDDVVFMELGKNHDDDNLKLNFDDDQYDYELKVSTFYNYAMMGVFKYLSKANMNFNRCFKKVNGDHYGIHLYVAGFRMPIAITWKFPMVKTDDDEECDLLFSHHNLSNNTTGSRKKIDHLYSIPFFEKAYAKLQTRWDRLNIGTADFFLRLISGYPQETFRIGSEKDLEQINFRDNDTIFVAHTGCSVKNEMILWDLIKPEKREHKDDSRYRIRLDSVLIQEQRAGVFFLFDPWQFVSWYGEYKKDSPELSDLITNSVDLDFDKYKNLFALKASDFAQTFGLITKVYMLNTWSYSYVRFKFDNRPFLEFEFELYEKDGMLSYDVWFCIYQQEPSLFDDNHDYRLTEYKVWLCVRDKDDDSLPWKLVMSMFADKQSVVKCFKKALRPYSFYKLIVWKVRTENTYLTFGFWVNTQSDQFRDKDNVVIKTEKYFLSKPVDKNEKVEKADRLAETSDRDYVVKKEESNNNIFIKSIFKLYRHQYLELRGKDKHDHPEGTHFEHISFVNEDIDYIEGCRIKDANGIFVLLKNSSVKSTFYDQIDLRKDTGFVLLKEDTNDHSFLTDDHKSYDEVDKTFENLVVNPKQEVCYYFTKVSQDYNLDFTNNLFVKQKLD